MKDQSNTQLEGNHLVQKVRVLREKNENVGPKAGIIHKVTECGLVTSNGGHVHATARSSHLLASKMLFEEGKCISNIM